MYASSIVRKRPLKGMKYFSTKSSWRTAVIAASCAVVVPKPRAVLGMNWIKPTAPLPAAFFFAGENDAPDSKLIIASKKLGSISRLAAICITFWRNSSVVFSIPGTLTRLGMSISSFVGM